MQFTFSVEKFHSDKWVELKTFLAENDEHHASRVYYICTHCRPLLNQNKLPARCVLNGLQTEKIPEELSHLTPLGRQLIQ